MKSTTWLRGWTISPRSLLPVLLTAAAGWKVALHALGSFPFHGDEAVVALMARHILQGARPTFFYGQAYMGSLDAYLIAAGFAVFGEHVWVIRLVQGLLYLGLLLTTWLIVREGFRSPWAAVIALAYLAVPPVNVTLYTTVTLGGYGEALLIGNGAFLCALRFARGRQAGSFTAMLGWITLFGFLTGLALWVLPLAWIMALPAGVLILAGSIRNLRQLPISRWAGLAGAAAAGFVGGSAPWWLYGLQNGWGELLIGLAGRPMGVEEYNRLAQIPAYLLYALLFGLPAQLGFRPPWDVFWLAMPLLPLVLALYLGLLVWMTRTALGRHAPRLFWLSVGVIAADVLLFILTPRGADPTGRYFLPLTVPLAALLGLALTQLRRPGLAAALTALLVSFHAWGTLQCALRNPPGITTQFGQSETTEPRGFAELEAALRKHRVSRGYSNYWVSFPLAFLSREEIILAPRLPYHTNLVYDPLDDRYPAYSKAALGAQSVAYVTRDQAQLAACLRDELAQLGADLVEEQVMGFQVVISRGVNIDPLDSGCYSVKSQ